MTIDFQTIYWECENRHQFNTGQVEDPGRCPVCQSWKIQCKYPQ